jgi:hypothetical protein
MSAARAMTSHMLELLAIMERLRAPGGCPWDREQTFASIAPYTIEEAYEVADAIERGFRRISEGRARRSLVPSGVPRADRARARARSISRRWRRRFATSLRRATRMCLGHGKPLTVAEQSVVWEDIKAEERDERGVATTGVRLRVTTPDAVAPTPRARSMACPARCPRSCAPTS